MANDDKIGGKALESFLTTWARHPLSIFVIMVLIPISFVFMMFHNTTNPESIFILTISSYSFAIVAIIIVSIILYNKKHVLYNSLDILSNELNRHIHILEESLEKIEIGLIEEPYEDGLELLCPKTAKVPISEDACENVRIFEFLMYVLNECGTIIPIKDTTKLKLAKFYYKKKEFSKAFENIMKIKNIEKLNKKTSDEAFLYKGVILKKMGKSKDSREVFEKIKDEFDSARCWQCMLKVDSKNKEEIQDYLKDTEKCPKSNLTKHCLNKHSSAYYALAKLSSGDESSMKDNMNKALALTNLAIKNFNSWTAYYNKACALCVMMNSNLEISGEDKCDQKEKIKDKIIACLKKAFDVRPALAVLSSSDDDLTWIKENYPHDFYELLGRIYDKNHSILSTTE